MKKYLRNNMNLFDKVEWVKHLATDAIGISEETVLRKMLRHLARKGTSQVNKFSIARFSQQELILDQVLKSNEVSPRTAYNWFIYMRAPEEACELGRQGKISQNELRRRASGVLRKCDPEHEKLGKEILQEIIKIVEAM